MRHSLAALLAVAIPITASASPDEDEATTPSDVEEVPPAAPRDDGPVVSPADIRLGTTTTTTTTTAPDGTTTTTTTTAAGELERPGGPKSAAEPTIDNGDPCSAHRRSWRSRVKGRLSIGFAGSHFGGRHEDENEGRQKSFVVRLNGRRGWSLELEASKLTFDSGDIAKTGGISVVKTFGDRPFAPYVLAGGGGGRYESLDGTEQKLHFGEIGGGVMYRRARFSIGIDVRRGVRELRADDDAMIERMATPTDEDGERDHYVRGRVLALINF